MRTKHTRRSKWRYEQERLRSWTVVLRVKKVFQSLGIFTLILLSKKRTKKNEKKARNKRLWKKTNGKDWDLSENYYELKIWWVSLFLILQLCYLFLRRRNKRVSMRKHVRWNVVTYEPRTAESRFCCAKAKRQDVYHLSFQCHYKRNLMTSKWCCW